MSFYFSGPIRTVGQAVAPPYLGHDRALAAAANYLFNRAMLPTSALSFPRVVPFGFPAADPSLRPLIQGTDLLYNHATSRIRHAPLLNLLAGILGDHSPIGF